MRKCICIGVLLLLIGAATHATVADIMPDKYRMEPIARNLSRPQALAMAPDGRVFFGERTTGNIRVIQHGKLLAAPFATLAVHNGEEEGLLGLALHPDFQTNGWLYVYYSSDAPRTQRIVRFRAAGNRGTDPTVILDNIGEAVSGRDNGGALTFGSDGKLYAGVGVLDADAQAQSWTSLSGKVLRMNDDGSTPADNPRPGDPYPYSLIYALGFRDVLDLEAHPAAGTLYGTDIYDEDAVCDEVNVPRSGLNFGWNTAACSAGSFTAPLQSINPAIGAAGLASYTGTRFPGAANNLFVAGKKDGKIIRDVLTGANFDGFGSSVSFYNPAGQTATCPLGWRDIDAPGDGWLYATADDPTTSKAGVYRVVYSEVGGTNSRPREASATPFIPLTLAPEGTGLRLWWENMRNDAWNCSPPTENQWDGTSLQGHCVAAVGTAKDRYTLWSGDLGSPFSYNHTVLAVTEGDGTSQNDALRSLKLASMPAGNKYFLISARDSNLEGSLGKASNGTERPGYSTSDQERCNKFGWGRGWNKCAPEWASAYPDQDNVYHTLSEFRGKVVLLSYGQYG